MTNIQKHHIRQLHKAAEIIRHDLDALNPIDRHRLRLDLQEFQTIIGMGVHYQQTDADPGVPERYLKEMVQGLRDAFFKLVERDYRVIDMELKDVHVGIYLNDASTPFFVHEKLPLGRQSVIYALFRHLAGSGLTPDRVCRCPREGCGNIFVLGSHARSDRMRYCSTRCSRLAATTAYRKRQAAEKEKTKKKSKWEMVTGTKKVRRKEQSATSAKAKKRGAK